MLLVGVQSTGESRLAVFQSTGELQLAFFQSICWGVVTGDITEKYVSTILPVFLLGLWVHIAQMKAFPHSTNMAERYHIFPWYHLTQRSLLRIWILQILIKVRNNFCQTKQLVLVSICKLPINLKFALFVAFYKAHHVCAIFRLIALQLRPDRS